MTLKTLADVHTLIERHLPAETRKKDTWLHVAFALPRPHAAPMRPMLPWRF